MAENLLYKTVLSKAMAYCAGKESCVSEIEMKLKTWGIGNEDAGKIISVLQKENFLNETRFAKSFAKDKFYQNKWGKIKIGMYLRVKKVSQENISEAFAEIDDKEYTDMIRKMMASHRKTIKAKNEYDLKAKLLRYGLSRGFESNILYEILGSDFEYENEAGS